MIVPRDRGSFLQELLVAEVLARRGEGPLAKKRWPSPRPRKRTDPSGATPAPTPMRTPTAPERER